METEYPILALRNTFNWGTADLKRPFVLQGKKYWFVICSDDYSRYLLLAQHFDYVPSTNDLTSLLDNLNKKPQNILTDNAKQFAKQWKNGASITI